MASAVTVIFGANSTQFQAELAKMQQMAQISAAKISSGTVMGGGHGPGGMTGIIRESSTVVREIAMGRGLGRILGSMSLLVQYTKLFLTGAKDAATYSEQLAAGYERLALKANLAAIAAMKKAEAAAADAYAEGMEDEMTIAAADADMAKAITAKADAVAAQEKAAAALEAAQAEQAEAAAAGEATAASLPLMAIFIGIIAVLAVLYGAYKIVHGILHSLEEQEIKSAQTARELNLTYEEEAAALDKLASAADKTEDALRKMTAAHDDYAKRVDATVEAQKNFYEHSKKLADLKKDADLTNVDIAEKQGLITHEQAVRQKEDIEKKANSDAAAAKTAELLKERDLLLVSSQRAQDFAKQKREEAQAASDKINTSPEVKANAEELARLENLQKQLRKDADKYAEDAAKTAPGEEKDHLLNLAKTNNIMADTAQLQANDQRAKMKPGEIAAADAMTAATEATNNAKTIGEKAVKATTEWANQEKNSPSEVAAENANIDLKAKEELLKVEKSDEKGYSLNSQQKVGAYAATAPILLQQLNALRSIDHKVTPVAPPSNNPPGEKKPQLGTRPAGQNRHQTGINV
jgi:hypothetical protein